MHRDFLTARKEQLDAAYQQLRRQLTEAQQRVQEFTTQAILLEGKLQELAFLIDQETPAVPLESLLPEGVTLAPPDAPAAA